MPILQLTLDKRRVKQDKSFPLVFRIFMNGKSRDISTGFSLKENEWNSKTESVNKNHAPFAIINERLKELKADYFSKMVEFEKTHPRNNNIQRLKEFITSEEEEKAVITIYDFWKQEIAFLHQANRNGGATVYAESLAALHKAKSLKILFSEADYSFLKALEGKLISNGNKINTVGIHFRTFRAVYNKAINAKLASFDQYPFRSYRIRRESSTPKVLTIEEMRAYFSFDISPESYLYESWLLGKLMFMLIGINFKDMILMKESQLHNGRVFYNRFKTGKRYSIKLHPQALQIIEHFKGRDKFTVLGKVKEEELTNKIEIATVIRRKNRAFNSHLREIGKRLGFKERMRGYVFRYTWANFAKQLGYSKDLIAEALGHEYGNPVTGIYLEGYDLELIDLMNTEVCNKIIQEGSS